MSQSVTLTYNFQTYRLKTSPAQILSQLVNEGCKHFKLESPETYILKHGKNKLDLSLPVRFANLPQGSKLELVQVSNLSDKKSSMKNGISSSKVTIKLQIFPPQNDSSFRSPPANSLVGQFNSSDLVSDLLVSFEKSLSETLMNRNGYETIVQSFTATLNSISEFESTTLDSLGLQSGNHSLRLRFKKHPDSAESRTQQSHSKSIDREDKVKQSRKMEEANNVTKADDVIQTRNVEESPEGSRPKSSTIEEDKARELPHIEVYKNVAFQPIRHYEHEESTYEMSIDQARVYQSMLSRQAGSKQMMSKRQRDELAAKNRRKIEFDDCIIRIKFPDQNTVQLVLPARTSTLGDLYNVLVNDVLLLDENEIEFSKRGEALLFELDIPYPRTSVLSSLDDFDKELVNHCGFGHRSLLVLKQDTPKMQYIKDKYLQAAKTLNDLDEVKLESSRGELADDTPPASKKLPSLFNSSEASTSSHKKKVPKWFTMGKK